jgi:hypothetical protein
MPAVPTMAVALPSMCPIPVDTPVAMRHRQAAGGAELAVLGVHAGRDPLHVWHEFGAQPHRIGRASLAGLIAALGGGWVKDCKKRDDRQHQPANETHSPQHMFLSLVSCGLLPDAVT